MSKKRKHKATVSKKEIARRVQHVRDLVLQLTENLSSNMDHLEHRLDTLDRAVAALQPRTSRGKKA